MTVASRCAWCERREAISYYGVPVCGECERELRGVVSEEAVAVGVRSYRNKQRVNRRRK